MMTILRRAVALMIPFCVLGCSETRVSDAIATSPTDPEPSHALIVAQSETRLNPVPPNGWDSLSESAFRYFQRMGPLEYAVRLGGVPEVPVWRVRLRLYPIWQDDNLLYHVTVDHYNLSPDLYQSVVSSYGEENADPSLNNTVPHQHIDLEFLPVMNVAADWLSDATQMSTSAVTTSPICGLGTSCAELYTPEGLEWNGESTVALETAPWASAGDPLPMMVRALTQQAGWLQDGGWRIQGEMPEGTSNERPWVEILVSNYPGPGGGYVAHWIEREADDSVRATVYQLYSDPMATSGFVSQGYICARGADVGQVRSLCP